MYNICIHIYVYINKYIQNTHTDIYMYTYIYMCVCVYIYILIYKVVISDPRHTKCSNLTEASKMDVVYMQT